MLHVALVAMLLVATTGLPQARAASTAAPVLVTKGVEAASLFPSLARGGSRVAFQSEGASLAASDTNGLPDVFVYDSASRLTTCASVGATGMPAAGRSPSISADGRYVAFESTSSAFGGADTNGTWDVVVRDLASATTTYGSAAGTSTIGNGASRTPALSADGRYLAFVSEASNLVDSDTNGAEDVFLRDLSTGAISRVSVSTGGTQANGDSSNPSISADGRYVTFASTASNFVTDANGASDIFIRDRVAGTTTLVSVSSSAKPGNLRSTRPSISADGRSVAFESDASDLVGGDSNGVRDVFVRNLALGKTERASVSSSEAEGDSASQHAAMGADGRYVVFTSASALVTGDTNGSSDVFVRDTVSGTTTRLSTGTGGIQGNGASADGAVAPDGRAFAFDSFATNLVSGDTNGAWDVFVVPGSRVAERIAGRDRYATAVAASRRAYPGRASAVVIATGANWPDALGGAALAGAVGGPVLLTDKAMLPAAVSSEIARLKPSRAYILGGEASVGGQVAAQLAKLVGAGKVERIGGADRYATATRIAAKVVAIKGGSYSRTVLVSTGENYPDALAASPVAEAKGYPVVLVRPGATPKLPAGTRSAVVLGGTRSVLTRTEDALKRALGPSSVRRIGGKDRYATGALIAKWAVTQGLSWDGVLVASGENYPDALAGGAAAGHLGSVMLLTPGATLAPAASASLKANAASVFTLRVIGGKATVSDAVLGQAKSALGMK